MIHPTAVVDSSARLDPSVVVGPYCVIDADVVVGPGCRLGPHVHLTGHTSIGADNLFHTGCVIGDEPQDLKYDGSPTRLRIGDRNVFREQAIVHRASTPQGETVIGSGCFLMAHCHIGHDVTLGNSVIVANGVLIAGYATVDDRAFFSGNSLVHQFVRVGTLALLQGGAAVSKDLPPYTIGRGVNSICGLNTVGLRRAGFSSEDRVELKKVYRLLFRSGLMRQEALAQAEAFSSPGARKLVEFLRATRRGVCADDGDRGSDRELDAV